MDDLPAGRLPLQDNRPAVHEAGAIVEMERGDGNVSGDLNVEIPRLDVHVRSLGSASANPIEYFLKGSFKFLASGSAMWELAGIEDGGVVGKKKSKALPIEIVEGLDKIGQGLADFIRILRGRSVDVHRQHRKREQKEYAASFHRVAVYKAPLSKTGVRISKARKASCTAASTKFQCALRRHQVSCSYDRVDDLKNPARTVPIEMALYNRITQ